MAFNIFKKEEKEKQKNEKKAELKKNATAPVDKTKKHLRKRQKIQFPIPLLRQKIEEQLMSARF